METQTTDDISTGILTIIMIFSLLVFFAPVIIVYCRKISKKHIFTAYYIACIFLIGTSIEPENENAVSFLPFIFWIISLALAIFIERKPKQEATYTENPFFEPKEYESRFEEANDYDTEEEYTPKQFTMNEYTRSKPPTIKQEAFLRLNNIYKGDETRGTASDAISRVIERDRSKMGDCIRYMEREEIYWRKIKYYIACNWINIKPKKRGYGNEREEEKLDDVYATWDFENAYRAFLQEHRNISEKELYEKLRDQLGLKINRTVAKRVSQSQFKQQVQQQGSGCLLFFFVSGLFLFKGFELIFLA